ncbi:hypothetical protein ACFPFX_04975 [Streptomyces mauvecolor]|uniref:Uncharacterized protein n=1 Tax=Streptomyces mauvecolor TaxID=58345 RepID=A0ABV9UF38_9ACTN
MNTSTTVSWVTDPISAVRHAQTLHSIDGCWTRADVERLVDVHPDWKIRREFSDLLVVGLEPSERHAGLGPELFFDKRAPKSPDVGRVRLPLVEFGLQTTLADRTAALRELAAALSDIGQPTPVPAAADGFGLRWQSDARTMLLQSNQRRAWVSIQPTGPNTSRLTSSTQSPPSYPCCTTAPRERAADLASNSGSPQRRAGPWNSTKHRPEPSSKPPTRTAR